MSLGDELAYTSASEIALLIRQRKLSPVEVIDAFLDRIENRNPSINAFIFVGADDARKAAKEAENAVMKGDTLAPLHGVPVAIKDLFDFKPGWPATFGGIRAMKDFVMHTHCAFAERIEEAGAVILGKTNSPTMGMRGTCDNFLFGATSTPFDRTRNSGGSSGGSASAVADGLLPLAEGTDGGGSIRIPAAFCGVYGYKASFGRVPFLSRPNAFAGDTPFLFEGPITRTVEDAAIALTVLSGYHPGDPFSVDEKVDFRGSIHRPIKDWKIAYSPDWDVFPVDPRVEACVREALKGFEEAGATVEEVKVGITRDQKELGDLWCRLISPVNVAAFEGFKAGGLDLLGAHRDDFPPEYLRWVEEGYKMTALDFYQDQEIRSEIYDAIQGVLNSYDLIVTPTLACMPVENRSDGNTVGPKEINGIEVNELIGWCLTYPVNYTGHPACSIPAGLVDGLPVGMQIVGRRWADSDVLAASAAFERTRPWKDSYQICRDRPL